LSTTATASVSSLHLQLFSADKRELEHLLTETFLIEPKSIQTVVAETYRDVHNSATVALSVSVKGGGTVRLGTHADSNLKDPAHYGAFVSLVSKCLAHTHFDTLYK
jgi:hypothetical protein